jgi:DNA-binding transcriptional LysR family regulator
MNEFRDIDIRKLDGGLLLVFRELLRRRRAREAGWQLGLSQPAVSHALSRLRELFDDPLFLRRPHGLEPTARALELGPRIEALIELAGAAISRRGRFNPADGDRAFAIGGYDSAFAGFAAPLLAAVSAEAPRAMVRFLDMLQWNAVDALKRGEIDLAVGRFGELPTGLASALLFEDEYCLVARKGHPGIRRGKVDATTYVETPHIFVAPPPRHPGDVWAPAEAAAIYGDLPARTEVSTLAYVPRFSMAMMLVADTDAFADMPRALASRFAERLGLVALEHPFPGAMRIDAVRREGNDPGVDWLWEKTLAAARRPRPAARPSGGARQLPARARSGRKPRSSL